MHADWSMVSPSFLFGLEQKLIFWVLSQQECDIDHLFIFHVEV